MNENPDYIHGDDLIWLQNNPLFSSLDSSVDHICNTCGIEQVRAGALSAYEKLTPDERADLVCIISTLSETDLITTGLTGLAREYFAWAWANMGEPEDTPSLEVEMFINTLESFTPAETMGIQCWAKGFWARCAKGDAPSDFANDKTPLLPGAPLLPSRREKKDDGETLK